MHRDDSELMQAVQAGDFRLFDELVSRYRGVLQRVAAGMLEDAGLAEDIVQETFLAVFAARHTYNPEFQFRTWLWTILINRCKRARARRQRLPQVLARSCVEAGERAMITEPAIPDTVLATALRMEQQAELASWLNELSDPQADAIRLRFFAGLTYDQIAHAMGVSLGGAKLRVRSGLAALAKIVRSRRGDDS